MGTIATAPVLLDERLQELRRVTEEALETARKERDTALVLRCVAQLHSIIKTEVKLYGKSLP